MTQKTALVLMSGGIDSTVALAWSQVKGYRSTGLFFQTGQRQETQEGLAVERVARFYGINTMWIDVKLPDAYGEHFVVPFRNGVLLAHACSIGIEARWDYLVHGMYSQPGWGFEYPDSTPEFLGTFSALPKIYGSNLRILSPFSGLTKADVVRMGRGFNVPFDLTWSCYNPKEDEPCGECPACKKRAWAMGDSDEL